MQPQVQRVLDELHARNLLRLVAAIAAHRGVVLADLCGETRSQSVARARQETWWCLCMHPERFYSLVEIARIFGRHHTTVRAGVIAHQRRLDRASASTAA